MEGSSTSCSWDRPLMEGSSTSCSWDRPLVEGPSTPCSWDRPLVEGPSTPVEVSVLDPVLPGLERRGRGLLFPRPDQHPSTVLTTL